MPRTAVIVPAAGRGQRAGETRNKMLQPLGEAPVIEHAVRVFHDHPAIDQVAVVAAEREFAELDRIFADGAAWPKLAAWVPGGAERQDSVRNGIEALAGSPPDWVIVHDGARPFCSPALIGRVLAALVEHPAVVPLLPIHDTVRWIGEGTSSVADRAHLRLSQTPQGFHWSVLREAHRLAAQHGLVGTDDAQLAEEMGVSPHFVEGEARNVKLTTGSDFALGAWLLANPGWGR